MKLKALYREIVKKGIAEDVRKAKAIEALLKRKQKEFDRLNKPEREYFDRDSLFNPFSDSRILCGDPESNIKSMIVGIDIDGSELLLADRLKTQGKKIDLVISHHPQGAAYAQFYDVMDLQVDIFAQQGVSLSVSENLLNKRKLQVARRVSAANHVRAVDIAKLLKLNFICMHTPCDNCAYQYLKKIIIKAKPQNLGETIDLLFTVPEYIDSAKNNNPPKIVVGNKSSRCENIHFEFTGGTEGPQDIYKELAAKGIDTVIAMHQSEEHFKKCREFNLNVIFASHIASDNLGVNIMLDYLEQKDKFKIYEFSGFKRFERKRKQPLI